MHDHSKGASNSRTHETFLPKQIHKSSSDFSRRADKSATAAADAEATAPYGEQIPASKSHSLPSASPGKADRPAAAAEVAAASAAYRAHTDSSASKAKRSSNTASPARGDKAAAAADAAEAASKAHADEIQQGMVEAIQATNKVMAASGQAGIRRVWMQELPSSPQTEPFINQESFIDLRCQKPTASQTHAGMPWEWQK